MSAKKEQPKKKGLKTGPKPKDAKGLTHEQAIFVEKYIQSNNIWQAAIDAGYSDPSYGYQLLRKPPILAEVVRRKNELLAIHKKDSQTVLNLTFELAKATIKNVASWTPDKINWKGSKELTDGELYGIGSLENTKYGRKVRMDLQGRAKALDFLGRYFGLWTDKDAIEDMLSRLPEEIREPLRAAICKHQQKGKDNGDTAKA